MNYGWPWEDILNKVIDREGDFVNNPFDKGGPTKYGITLATLRRYKNNEFLTAKDVENISTDLAKEIYWALWIVEPSNKYHLLPVNEPFCDLLLDTAILFSPARANKWLQDSINCILQSDNHLTVDGIIGPATRTQAARCNTIDLTMAIVVRRVKRHCKRCVEDPSQLIFLEGWIERSTKFLGNLIG